MRELAVRLPDGDERLWRCVRERVEQRDGLWSRVRELHLAPVRLERHLLERDMHVHVHAQLVELQRQPR
jgi:hypothetical protein